MRKPRVLCVNEFSKLNTGYSCIGRNLLKEFHESEKYDITELACVPDPNAKIAMADGSLKNISLIEVDDKVISHTGKSQTVTQISQRNFSGQLVKISRHIFGHSCLEVTDNHPVLAIKKNDAYIGVGSNQLCFRANPHYQWIQAKDLQVGDFVCYANPIHNRHTKNKIIVGDYSTLLDDDFAFFFGWFLAEGCIVNHHKNGPSIFNICASLKEEYHINRIKDILCSKFHIRSNIVKREDNGVFEITFYNKDFSRFIYSLCGMSSRNKFISNIFWNAPRSFIIKLAASYFEGDGWSSKDGNCINASTSSRRLALDITRLLLKNNIICSCKQQNKGSYLLCINGEYASEISKYFIYKNKDFNQLSRKEYIEIDNLIFYHISQIHKREYDGIVYNFGVENDESYICNNFVVHNCYYNEADPLMQQMRATLPWRVFGNIPTNDQERQIYESHPTNEFGAFKFEQICLETQPDIVISFRDFWMDSFIDQSPFRRFYKTVMMPTVDARSQSPEWLSLYQNTDHVLTYTKFAENVLREESGNTINLRGVATPAVDMSIYLSIKDKKSHKQQMGIRPDSIIVGMTARNQRRKLYPELAEAFVKFVEDGNFGDTSNVYLYWHTSHPDVGWNIADLIKNNGLSRKVLLTYFCNNPQCGCYFPSWYKDPLTVCPRCHQASATLSNSQVGIDDASLAKIYNCMDLYVQMVTNEGLGIPAVEASACGISLCGTYYSGVEDLIDNLQGKPLYPRTIFMEAETGRKLALPSIDELVSYMKEFTSLPESMRLRLGMRTADLCRKHYGSWKKVAQQWMNIFDEIPISDVSQWLSPIDYVPIEGIQPPGPDKMNDEQFINWCVGSILHRPDWVNNYVGLKMWRDLSWGRTIKNTLGFVIGDLSQLGAKPAYDKCDRGYIFNIVCGMRNKINQFELLRKQYVDAGRIK